MDARVLQGRRASAVQHASCEARDARRVGGPAQWHAVCVSISSPLPGPGAFAPVTTYDLKTMLLSSTPHLHVPHARGRWFTPLLVACALALLGCRERGSDLTRHIGSKQEASAVTDNPSRPTKNENRDPNQRVIESPGVERGFADASGGALSARESAETPQPADHQTETSSRANRRQPNEEKQADRAPAE
jgi:hypothetical protein